MRDNVMCAIGRVTGGIALLSMLAFAAPVSAVTDKSDLLVGMTLSPTENLF